MDQLFRNIRLGGRRVGTSAFALGHRGPTLQRNGATIHSSAAPQARISARSVVQHDGCYISRVDIHVWTPLRPQVHWTTLRPRYASAILYGAGAGAFALGIAAGMEEINKYLKPADDNQEQKSPHWPHKSEPVRDRWSTSFK